MNDQTANIRRLRGFYGAKPKTILEAQEWKQRLGNYSTETVDKAITCHIETSEKNEMPALGRICNLALEIDKKMMEMDRAVFDTARGRKEEK